MTNTICFSVSTPKDTNLKDFLDTLHDECIINAAVKPENIEVRDNESNNEISFTLTIAVDDMDDDQIDEEIEEIRSLLSTYVKNNVVLDEIFIDG